jgi:hypothetical protein
MMNQQTTISTASKCKFCDRPIKWQKQPAGNYVPHEQNGVDHRERCAGIAPQTKDRLRTANHEAAVRKFLWAAAKQRTADKSAIYKPKRAIS